MINSIVCHFWYFSKVNQLFIHTKLIYVLHWFFEKMQKIETTNVYKVLFRTNMDVTVNDLWSLDGYDRLLRGWGNTDFIVYVVYCEVA